MMLRFRRYRVFLSVAVVCVLTIYYLSLDGSWEAASNISVEQLKTFGSNSQSPESGNTEPSKDNNSPVDIDSNAALQVTSVPIVGDVPIPQSTSSSTSSSSSIFENVVAPTPPTRPNLDKLNDLSGDPDTEPAIPVEQIKQQFGQHGQGRLEAKPFKAEHPQHHWTKQPEHFPVSSASLIALPTGRSQKIPKIQKTFGSESSAARTERERKLAAIKDAFLHAWTGYKEKALPHDELKPVSGEHRDPFNGWGATLVDTLDTLWIMGLKTEFESAVDAVAEIDFTTSLRKDIPLFETTIRYLGGLLAAYDISSQKFPVLLDKAQELAEVLMGAFDTPNRMPLTYYNWAPSYASQPHRAGTRVVMAELGSLSMEFTRLAQLTKEDKYYDAVARITNALEEYQSKTKLPGLWPIHVDTSGCKKPDLDLGLTSRLPDSEASDPSKEEPAKDGATILEKKPKAHDKTRVSKSIIEDNLADTTANTKRMLSKRQLDDFETNPITGSGKSSSSSSSTESSENTPEEHSKLTEQSVSSMDDFADVDCEPQGLASPPNEKIDKFTLGAMSDSTFEYLPKEYMLLGGQLDQYRTMYEYAMDTARETLLYRPMTPDGKDILFAGRLETPGETKVNAASEENPSSPQLKPRFIYEGAHLTCFAGGMFAIGAKIFGIEGDLDIGRRLADGCVWAYDISASGIMPEEFNLVPCENTKSCTWSDKAWWDALDPDPKSRMERVKDWNENQRKLAEQVAAAEAKAEGEAASEEPNTQAPETGEIVGLDTEVGETRVAASGDAGLVKRQVVKSSIKMEDDTTAAAARNRVTSDDGSAGSKSSPLMKSSIRYENDDTIAAAAALSGANQVDSIPTTTNPSQKADTDASVTAKDTTDDEQVTEVLRSIFTPQPVVSHKDFAEAVAKERRLPQGFQSIGRREYILRPEAIESVFIMFRITGDESWREKGWRMFNAIQKNTRTEFANSAINDVTSAIPEFRDSMESFWLAETLKYFYLLFSEPGVVSLDEWVLNTEAHPFRRPQ